MLTALETLPDDRVVLRVEVPASDVDHAFEHALRDLAREVKIPGFRKGKVPPAVVRSRLGDEAVVEEALRGHLSAWVARALQEARVEAVDRPEIDYEDPPAEGTPFAFTATVAVPPRAELPEVLDLQAVREPVQVPDTAVDEALERARESAARLEPIEDRAAELGDFALVDFVGSIGGKPIPDGTANDLLVQLGSGRLIRGMEQAVVGLRPGETATTTVGFPKDYEVKRVAGKTAEFRITLKELKQRVLPDLDDALAREVSEFDTLEELRANVAEEIRAGVERNLEGRFRAGVLAALGRAATVEVPRTMTLRRVEARLEDAARGLQQRGISFDAYLRSVGRTVPQLATEMAPEVEGEIREELALQAFADREGIEVTDEDVRLFVRESAEAEGEDVEASLARLEEPIVLETLRDDLRLKAALDRAVERATAITPEVAEAREKLWTPGKDEGSAGSAPKPTLWTPGSGA